MHAQDLALVKSLVLCRKISRVSGSLNIPRNIPSARCVDDISLTGSEEQGVAHSSDDLVRGRSASGGGKHHPTYEAGYHSASGQEGSWNYAHEIRI